MRGRGRPHRRAQEPPPDPTQPPAVRETPAWTHVTRTRQPAAAPETSNAASAAQHPRRVRGRAAWGCSYSLGRRRHRLPSATLADSGCHALCSPSVCPAGWPGIFCYPSGSLIQGGAGVRRLASAAPDDSGQLRSPGRTAFPASGGLGYSAPVRIPGGRWEPTLSSIAGCHKILSGFMHANALPSRDYRP